MMPPRQKRKADGKESAPDAKETTSARKHTRSQTIPVAVTKSNMTGLYLSQRQLLHHNQALQGNVFRPPFVENIFDIDAKSPYQKSRSFPQEEKCHLA